MGEAVPWWVEIADDAPRLGLSKCASCGAETDSVDVFCPNDDASLLGQLASERTLLKATYVLRAIAVAAALAVGYLRWAWPAYVAGVVFAAAFALLFVRNHRAALAYLAVVVASVAAGHGIWEAMGGLGLGSVVIGALLFALIAELLFVAGVTLRMASQVSQWGREFDVSSQTVLTTAIGFTMTIAALVVLALAYITEDVIVDWLSWGALHVAPLTASASVIAILVSSVAYTIRASMFVVPDAVSYREVLASVRFDRIPMPPSGARLTALELFANTMQRAAIAFANGVTTAVESAYNRQVRGVINGLARAMVALANTCYRAVVKLARHTARTLRRSGVVAARCASWSWALGSRFTTAFALPIALAWLVCAELWWLAAEFQGYVAGEAPWFSPIVSLLRAILVAAAGAAMTMTLLRIPPVTFGRKFATTASAIGGNAFLFFVVIAWTLGIVGWATDGPYRVGWVTLTSTGVIACVLIALRTRKRAVVSL
jgi:hypothetical protein